MSYTLKEGEVAVILRPQYDGNDEWDGSSTTGVVFNTDREDEGVQHGIEVAILMAAFLDFIQDFPDYADPIESRRIAMLEDMFPEAFAAAQEEVEREEGSNVVQLNRWTKTEGSA
jgi:hypothetical protein